MTFTRFSMRVLYTKYPVQCIEQQNVHFYLYNWVYWSVIKWEFRGSCTLVREDIWQRASLYSTPYHEWNCKSQVGKIWRGLYCLWAASYLSMQPRTYVAHCCLLTIVLGKCFPVIGSSSVFTHVSQNIFCFLLWVHFLLFGLLGEIEETCGAGWHFLGAA